MPAVRTLLLWLDMAGGIVGHQFADGDADGSDNLLQATERRIAAGGQDFRWHHRLVWREEVAMKTNNSIEFVFALVCGWP